MALVALQFHSHATQLRKYKHVCSAVAVAVADPPHAVKAPRLMAGLRHEEMDLFCFETRAESMSRASSSGQLWM